LAEHQSHQLRHEFFHLVVVVLYESLCFWFAALGVKFQLTIC
jgi:hypothetical protein